MGKDFWPMWGLFLLFIIFATVLTHWAGLTEFAIFWIVAGVIGSVVLILSFRNGTTRAGK